MLNAPRIFWGLREVGKEMWVKKCNLFKEISYQYNKRGGLEILTKVDTALNKPINKFIIYT